MSKLVGMRWGALSEETRISLLEGASCIDGETGNDVNEGECIIDLTDTLSVCGNIIDYEIVVDDDAIIYNPSEGIILEAKDTNINFQINEVMTVNEAAGIWNKCEGTIRAAIKAKKFILGVDYRKAGRITLITREAMEALYGEPKTE